jgi:hypothetical protein
MTTAREASIRLASHLADLLRREQGTLADFLVALAEYDRRRLWLDLGHPSLFCFLHRELGLSKGAAHYRKTAAHLVQRFPEVVEPLRDGRLCITSVVELAKVLTPENRHLVLPRFFHRSRREAMAVAAEIRPRSAAPHREVVTRVPDAGQLDPLPESARPVQPVELDPTHPLRAMPEAEGLSPAPGLPSQLGPAARAGAGVPLSPGFPSRPDGALATASAGSTSPASPAPGCPGPPGAEPPPPPTQPAGPPVPRDTAVPLTADLRRLHVTVSRRFLEKLEAARDALSHALPGANAEEVLEAGLDLLLERHAKRRGLVARPRAGPTAGRRTAGGAAGSPSSGAPPKAFATRGSPRAKGSSGGGSAAVGSPARGSPSAGAPVREAGARPAAVPAAVKRAVWMRDAGKCQWPLSSGGICGSTLRVELDHVVPRARGGPSTVENCRLLCRFHNGVAARNALGDAWMDRFTRGRAGRGDSGDARAGDSRGGGP